METSTVIVSAPRPSKVEMPVSFREWRDEDRAFVMDSWLRSYRSSKWAGITPNHLYFDVTRVCINQLLDRGAKILIAHAPTSEDAIIGFLCYEQLKNGEVAVHYCYVKDPYRRAGVASRLIARVYTDHEKPLYYTFRTDFAKYFKGIRLGFAPEIARRK